MTLLVPVWAGVCWFLTSTLGWEWWAGVVLFWLAPVALLMVFGQRQPDDLATMWLSEGQAGSGQRRSLADPTCANEDCRESWTTQITFVTGEMYRGCERHAPIVIRMARASGDDDPLPIPAIREVVRRAAQA